MTIEDLIRQARERLSAALTERQAHADRVTELRARIDTDTPPTETEIRAAVDARAAADARIDEIRSRVDELVADQAREAEVAKLQREFHPTGPGRPVDKRHDDGVIQREERAYHEGNDPRGEQFLRDAWASQRRGARIERMDRHLSEVRVDQGQYLERANGTANWSGLAVPQYLTDLFAPVARTGRPLADVCRRHDLPPVGMTVNIGRGTTGTSTAVQASQGDPVSETNYDDTILTVNVQTIAGQQTSSIQAIRRASGSLDITMEDLVRSWHSTLDSTLINQATTGLTNVAAAVTYTDSSPTVAELWPKLLGAEANIEAGLMDMGSGELVAVMHSRRWKWMQSQVGTSYPLVASPGIPVGAAGVDLGGKYGSGVRGTLPSGAAVIVDNNVATNLGGGTEDEIYFVDPTECHLWEDPNQPLFIECYENAAAGNLQALFVCYGFAAYTFGRYTAATSKISGTGLAAPTF